jgi:hypothetical protein
MYIYRYLTLFFSASVSWLLHYILSPSIFPFAQVIGRRYNPHYIF